MRMKDDESNRKQQSIELVDNLFLISIFLQRTGNKQIAEFDLNQSHFSVLAEIVKTGNIAQKDILGLFMLEKSNLSKIIKKLEQKELISVKKPENDRRKTILKATDKGEKLFSECSEKLNMLKEKFTSNLTNSELDQIHHSIKKLEQLVKYHAVQINNTHKQ